jgi:hypothetical protein
MVVVVACVASRWLSGVRLVLETRLTRLEHHLSLKTCTRGSRRVASRAPAAGVLLLPHPFLVLIPALRLVVASVIVAVVITVGG